MQKQEAICNGCGMKFLFEKEEMTYHACWHCRHRYPRSLLEATYKSNYYALRLSNDEIILFEQAEFTGDYVRLTGKGSEDKKAFLELYPDTQIADPGGMDVKLGSILWSESVEKEWN